jgi:DNA-binding CsgD family transcriptional regulator
MDTHENTEIGHEQGSEFWERIRQAANIPCLVSGLFCADQKKLQAMTAFADSASDGAAPEELIRHISARLAAFTAVQPASAQKDVRVTNYPLWLRLNNVVVGVGRPSASLYPVVAYVEPKQATSVGVQDLLELGLSRAESALTPKDGIRSPWTDGLAETTLRLLSIGFFVVDMHCNILHDQSGDDRAKDTLWVTSRSRLSVKSEAERAALQAAITAATSDKRLGSLTSVTSKVGRMQMVAVAPVQQGDQALALVLFERRQTDHRALREHFFRIHELTKSEGLIASEVLDGRAPAEVAKLTGMSVGTVRGYLKQVFAKTGTHRQSELVSYYYASILPIGANIARADLGAAPSGHRPANAAQQVHDRRLN